MKPGKDVTVWQDYTSSEVFMGVFVSAGRHDRGVLRWRKIQEDSVDYRDVTTKVLGKLPSTLLISSNITYAIYDEVLNATR